MAKVYARVREGRLAGTKLTKVAAYTAESQKAIRRTAAKRAVKASGILHAHRHDGHARITVERGDLDYYVVLNDERGQAAAMTIEFGRKGGNLDKNGNEVTHMDPVAPLRQAFGMPVTYGGGG